MPFTRDPAASRSQARTELPLVRAVEDGGGPKLPVGAPGFGPDQVEGHLPAQRRPAARQHGRG